jgi:hypothetical protein
MTESGQLDLVAVLQDQTNAAEQSLVDIEETLNPAIDANPNDKLLMEMFDVVTDAEESVKALRDLLGTMEHRDREELP